jgi:hypothetical protein
MANPAGFQQIGVVEGFYGRVWSEAEREAFIAGLAPFGLNTYLYAPKHEPALGAALLEPLDKAAAQRLHRLQRLCEERGIALLAGLHLEPPYDPALDAHREALAQKARQIAELGLAGFAVLFDDLPAGRSPLGPHGADPFGGSLAAAQAHAFRALHDALERGRAQATWLVCPGRYTLDPVLEEISGTFEPDYLARLHAALPSEVPWLWTGPRVCSPTVTPADAAGYRALLGAGGARRPLALWDNYPVNDARMQGRLHLDPLGGRAPDLPAAVQGYLFNPLLQPGLGLIPGASCLAYANDPAGYDPTAAWHAALQAFLPPALHGPFAEFAALTRPFQQAGGLPPVWPRGAFPILQRLVRAWPSLSAGEPAEPFLAIDLRRVLESLAQGLPPAMAGEAAPWLDRLRRALALIDASAQGAPPESLGPLRAQYSPPRGDMPTPEVLGPWFP